MKVDIALNKYFISRTRAQLTVPVEYTDCISRGVRLPNECPVYETKQSDGEDPVFEL